MIEVRIGLDAYRIATAELPLSARRVPGMPSVLGASAEVVGAGDGAAVIVLSDPAPDELSELPDGLRVVVDREWLRPDVVADAVTATAADAAAMFVAECAAPSGGGRRILREAIGWLRELSGEELVLREVGTAAGGAMALFDAGDRAATVLFTELSDPLARPRLRALAVGVERTEVEIDALGAASVTVSSETGDLRLPARRESRQRLALRRAIDAAGGAEVRDLEQLRLDDALAAAILESHKRR